MKERLRHTEGGDLHRSDLDDLLGRVGIDGDGDRPEPGDGSGGRRGGRRRGGDLRVEGVEFRDLSAGGSDGGDALALEPGEGPGPGGGPGRSHQGKNHPEDGDDASTSQHQPQVDTPTAPIGRRQAALAGHRGDVTGARALLADASASVRATALGALARLGSVGVDELVAGLKDPDAVVRRRACEVAAAHPRVSLLEALADPEPTVAEAAAWALGERGDLAGNAVAAGVVEALSEMAAAHADPLCREAAVAALGAIGQSNGLPAILAATTDRPAIRRRAILALAPFEGPEVTAALQRALTDKDWQVRQAAEDLLAD